MNIQAEKLELIKRLAEVNNRQIIDILKAILMPDAKPAKDETDLILANTELAQKIKEARQQIKDGNGVKVDLKGLWK